MSTPVEALPPHLVAEIEEMGRLMKAREGKEKSFLHALPKWDGLDRLSALVPSPSPSPEQMKELRIYALVPAGQVVPGAELHD